MSRYGNLESGIGPNPTYIQCVICQDPIYSTDPTLTHKPGCGHTYHSSCLVPWLDSQREADTEPSCPMCRGNLPPPMSLEEMVDELAYLEQLIPLVGSDQNAVPIASDDRTLAARRQRIARRIGDEYPDLSPEVLDARLSDARRRARSYLERDLAVHSDRHVSFEETERPTFVVHALIDLDRAFVDRFGEHFNATHLAVARRNMESFLRAIGPERAQVSELVRCVLNYVAEAGMYDPTASSDDSLTRPNNTTTSSNNTTHLTTPHRTPPAPNSPTEQSPALQHSFHTDSEREHNAAQRIATALTHDSSDSEAATVASSSSSSDQTAVQLAASLQDSESRLEASVAHLRHTRHRLETLRTNTTADLDRYLALDRAASSAQQPGPYTNTDRIWLSRELLASVDAEIHRSLIVEAETQAQRSQLLARILNVQELITRRTARELVDLTDRLLEERATISSAAAATATAGAEAGHDEDEEVVGDAPWLSMEELQDAEAAAHSPVRAMADLWYAPNDQSEEADRYRERQRERAAVEEGIREEVW